MLYLVQVSSNGYCLALTLFNSILRILHNEDRDMYGGLCFAWAETEQVNKICLMGYVSFK